jgi:hypothetical protein
MMSERIADDASRRFANVPSKNLTYDEPAIRIMLPYWQGIDAGVEAYGSSQRSHWVFLPAGTSPFLSLQRRSGVQESDLSDAPS